MTFLAKSWDAESLAKDTSERRMTRRVLNYWKALRDGEIYPPLSKFNVEAIPEFAPHGFLLDIRRDPDAPMLRYVGSALTEECGKSLAHQPLSSVPADTLLTRVSEHYRRVLEKRAPVGFEAEYVNAAGAEVMYRGIMVPFGPDPETIDHIVGSINSKPKAAVTSLTLPRAPLFVRPRPDLVGDTLDAAVEPPDDAPAMSPGLSEGLQHCRALARELDAANVRSRHALYNTLEAVYALSFEVEADSAGYAELLAAEGLKKQQRAPFMPLVKLVFSRQYDKTRLSEYSTALSFARRHQQSAEAFRSFIDNQPGGLKGCVHEERAARRAERGQRRDRVAEAKDVLRRLPPAGQVRDDGTGKTEFVVLLGRRRPDRKGVVDALRVLDEKPAVVEAILKRAAKRIAKEPAAG
jgi:hypothetical protein